MKKDLTIAEIVKICEGTLFCGDEKTSCHSFTKDTRTIQLGDTYIGIKGENFDGNLFYKEAFDKGATSAILEKDSFLKENNYSYSKPIILVKNSLEALKKLAEYKRKHSSAYFVGVTGSVGKTSTKDLIYSVLKEKYSALKTKENQNNNIGLPFTFLRLEKQEAAVIEMGMNQLGEIEYLSNITKPHIAVITNVGTAHIGELGSRENILKAKLEIQKGLTENGKLIINNDNDLLHAYYLENKKNIITIGIENTSDFQAQNIRMEENSSTFDICYKGNTCSINCPIPGKSFIYNSLVAFAVGTLLGLTKEQIQMGIKKSELTKNRVEFIKLKNKATIFNDSYNASVDSMIASLEILKNKKTKRRIAILGDMLELGKYSKELHEKVGEHVVKNKIDYLITVGKEAEYIASSAINKGMKQENIYICNKNEKAIEKIKELMQEQDTILIKASHGMHFNKIVESLRNL